MKKLITVALLTAMLLSCFAGCGMQKGAIVAPNSAENVAVDMSKFDLTLDAAASVYDGSFDATTNSADAIAWYDTYKNEADNEFDINNATELIYFFYLLSQSNYSFAGKTVILKTDVIVNAVAEATDTPAVSDLKTAYPTTEIPADVFFEGTFDGQGHIISGLYQKATVGYNSFFGPLKGATIKNVVFLNGYMESNDKQSSGISVKSTGDTTFENVYADIEITKNANSNGSACFVGQAAGGTLTIKNCMNVGNISSSKTYTGGFVGGTNADAAVAITISDSKNTGNVSGAAYTGGIVGGAAANSGNMITLTNVECTGNVEASNYSSGGLVGNVIANGGNITMTGCEMSGSVEVAAAKWTAGGLLGGTNAGCVAVIKNCEFSGTADLPAGSGGILGFANGGTSITIEDCVVSGTVTIALQRNKNCAGGAIIGLTKAPTVIKNCSLTGTLNLNIEAKANTEAANVYGGIIVGGADKDLTIEGCNLTGTVKAKDTSSTYAPPINAVSVVNSWNNVGYNTHVSGVNVNLNAASSFTDCELQWATVNPVIVGYQTKANGANTDVRFVAALGEIAAETGVGFKVSIQKKGEAAPTVHEAYVTSIYKSVNGTDGVESTTYTAADFYSDYLATLVIEGVPADYFAEGAFKDCQIIITPFTATEAGDVVTPVNGANVTIGSISAE